MANLLSTLSYKEEAKRKIKKLRSRFVLTMIWIPFLGVLYLLACLVAEQNLLVRRYITSILLWIVPAQIAAIVFLAMIVLRANGMLIGTLGAILLLVVILSAIQAIVTISKTK